MYNMITKAVTCDECGKSVSIALGSRRAAVREVEKEGWTYNALAQFYCPKCNSNHTELPDSQNSRRNRKLLPVTIECATCKASLDIKVKNKAMIAWDIAEHHWRRSGDDQYSCPKCK